MVTKIGLPENRKAMRGAGVAWERDKFFTEAYNAGFDAGVKYGKEQTERERNE
jgi:hypothetical protein